METVGQVIRQRSERQLQQGISRTSFSIPTEVAELAQAVCEKYGQEGATILSEYNADYIMRKKMDADACIFGKFPTLAELNKRFDNRFAAAWVMAHLHDLSEFCGCREKLNGQALKQCASIISMEFYYLKISELMLFFYRFKTGKYGRFYGAVDPLVITTALREFLIDRASAYARHEREEQVRQRMEWEKEAVSYEEYLRQKNGQNR